MGRLGALFMLCLVASPFFFVSKAGGFDEKDGITIVSSKLANQELHAVEKFMQKNGPIGSSGGDLEEAATKTDVRGDGVDAQSVLRVTPASVGNGGLPEARRDHDGDERQKQILRDVDAAVNQLFGGEEAVGAGPDDPLLSSLGVQAAEVVERETIASNQTAGAEKPVNLATVLDEAVDKEFLLDQKEESQESSESNYNKTLEKQEAKEETVIRIIKNPQTKGGSGSRPGEPSADILSEEDSADEPAEAEEEVEELIDHQNNEYVLANPNSGKMELQLDSILLQDLTLMFVCSSAIGMVLESLSVSPVAGYILSGSLLGPGGFGLLHRLVQIETISQLGVYLLLFVLGLEFKLDKLNGVRNVTLIGGLLEVLLMALAIGTITFLTGGMLKNGILLGATLSLSSTTIVLKSIENYGSQTIFKRIVTGTLLLQDSLIGILFALVPVFGSKEMNSNALVSFFWNLSLSLGLFFLVCLLLSRLLMPPLLNWMQRRCSLEVHRLFSVAFCFSIASLGGVLGISEELGAFAAGAIIGATVHAEKTLKNINQLETVFVALFLSSIGIIMSPGFLAQHAFFLGGTFFTCMLIKFVVFSFVISLFRVPFTTSLAIGFSLTPISEFAFVILSTSFKMKMIKRQWYMLFLGVTGLSMFISPFTGQIIKPLGVRENQAHRSLSPAGCRQRSPCSSGEDTDRSETEFNIEMMEKGARKQRGDTSSIVLRKQSESPALPK